MDQGLPQRRYQFRYKYSVISKTCVFLCVFSWLLLELLLKINAILMDLGVQESDRAIEVVLVLAALAAIFMSKTRCQCEGSGSVSDERRPGDLRGGVESGPICQYLI